MEEIIRIVGLDPRELGIAHFKARRFDPKGNPVIRNPNKESPLKWVNVMGEAFETGQITGPVSKPKGQISLTHATLHGGNVMEGCEKLARVFWLIEFLRSEIGLNLSLDGMRKVVQDIENILTSVPIVKDLDLARFEDNKVLDRSSNQELTV